MRCGLHANEAWPQRVDPFKRRPMSFIARANYPPSQVATAVGAAQQLLLVAQANAAIALQNGHAEATAFAGVKARLGLTNDELLR